MSDFIVPVKITMPMIQYIGLEITKWVKPTHQFTSGALTFQKPDKRVFDHIVDTLNLNKDTTCYVGDA
jgi:putative hydrolase of the HAD superfamily